MFELKKWFNFKVLSGVNRLSVATGFMFMIRNTVVAEEFCGGEKTLF